MTYEIDATNKPLGRIATEAVVALRGKNKTTFERHTAPAVKVLIKNVSKLKVTGKKLTDKVYVQYSQSLMDNNTAMRLKYALGKFWSVGVESGTNGNGVDLGFAVHKN